MAMSEYVLEPLDTGHHLIPSLANSGPKKTRFVQRSKKIEICRHLWNIAAAGVEVDFCLGGLALGDWHGGAWRQRTCSFFLIFCF
jgi:hypothetical protein